MTAKERYMTFCEKEKWIPIFSQPWWMDITCGCEKWDVILVGEGNDIKASMPFYIEQTIEGRSIKKAILTQNNGILIKYPEKQGVVAKQKYEEKIINEICNHIEQMNLIRYEQQYSYRFDNWLPFFWRYYKSMIRYTYVIEDTLDYEKVYSNYTSNVKKNLRKAKKLLTICETDDTQMFYQINELSFKRQNIEIPYSYEMFEKIYTESAQRNCGKLLIAKDDNHNVHSVAMIVWDEYSVYYLLNGTNPQLKQSQANVLLIDASIRIAGELGKKFDFEGSVIKNVNHAFREFGGIPMPYFKIWKDFDKNNMT